MKYAQDEITQARKYLLSILPPGAKVYTKLNHVSRSGMSRSISLYVISDKRLERIDYYASRLLGERIDAYDGITVGGCGMDMGFALVYSLGWKLYPEGFGIEMKLTIDNVDEYRYPKTPREAVELHAIGYDSRGRNGDPSGWDSDGGYALKQEWL